MNKKIVALIIMSIGVIGITACSNKNNIDVPKNDTPTKIEEKAETKPEEKPVVKENTPSRYSVAGIDDAADFERVFKTIQALVDKGEKEKVAEYIRYPLTSANITVTSKEEFIKNYDSMITEGVKKALVNQKVEETFVNYKGVMVGNGEVWFTVIFEGGTNTPKYLIQAINQI